jgi:hypothetical protein
MLVLLTNPMIATGSVETLKQFVSDHHIHPILVNFTAALVPISLGSDILGHAFHGESLRSTDFGRCASPPPSLP